MDRKRVLLSEFATANGLVVVNNSIDPTCFHQGFGSHKDGTFASKSLACQIKGWVVLEEESGCDYKYIHFTMERRTMVAASKKAGRWAINKLDLNRPVHLNSRANQSHWQYQRIEEGEGE